MGLTRKMIKVSTFGLAPIHYRDKQEREIRVAQKQLKVQREMLREQQRASRTHGAA